MNAGATSNRSYTTAAPTLPGDDASPFLLRVYLTRRPRWRHLSDFEPDRRPLQDEYKLYVWRSTTLRTLAHLLHSAQSSSSSSSSILTHPSSHHAFRLIYFDPHRSSWSARDLGREITRVSPLDLAQRVGSEEARQMLGLTTMAARTKGERVGSDPPQRQDQNGHGGQDGAIRLGDCGFVDGDVLECLITPPSSSSNSNHTQNGVRGAGLESIAAANSGGGRWGASVVEESSMSIRGADAAGGGQHYRTSTQRREYSRDDSGDGGMGSYSDRRPSSNWTDDRGRAHRADGSTGRW